ncbi:NEL-type E3 ubiquitin ligase domain-containing protein, partial [Pseudomonas viridiflava]|uniref:NEL-type E3 ubiquitin ligase domain-containing protein n=1 Tax=Pseudomonas viridiflava TaxID=33069 RepID=UPI0013CF0C27
DQGGLGQRFGSDVRAGVPGKIDEVDVHLAHQTSLADRLDLPWLSDHMLYRVTANVRPERIEQALTSVMALGEGDGLVNQMLLEPWWEQHLRTAYERQCSDNEHEFGERFLALDDLQTEQAQWASADTLEAAERNRLRERLKT